MHMQLLLFRSRLLSRYLSPLEHMVCATWEAALIPNIATNCGPHELLIKCNLCLAAASCTSSHHQRKQVLLPRVTLSGGWTLCTCPAQQHKAASSAMAQAAAAKQLVLHNTFSAHQQDQEAEC